MVKTADKYKKVIGIEFNITKYAPFNMKWTNEPIVKEHIY